MGIGSFFDNFMSGLAFGMLANNPFFGGMGCCCGYGFGGGFNNNRVDFGTFANPFPNIFGNVQPNYNNPISIMESFGNPGFPNFDLSQPMQTIWNNTMNSNSDFNKNYENLGKNNYSYNYCKQNYIQTYDMPFSSWFLPTQIPIGGYMQQYQPANVPVVNNQTTSTQSTNAEAQNVQTTNTQITTTLASSEGTLSTATVPTDNDSMEPDITDSETPRDTTINYDITSLKNFWSRKKNLPDAFYEKVIKIAKKIKCDPNDLMGVMWVESAKTFSPSTRNPNGGATGLIQFMPDTARTLGTTTQRLSAMTAIEQLEYVEKYLIIQKTAGGYRDNETIDRGTLYSLVFLPGRSKRRILTSRGENYYEQNKILDYNNDGNITKEDLANVITANMS